MVVLSGGRTVLGHGGLVDVSAGILVILIGVWMFGEIPVAPRIVGWLIIATAVYLSRIKRR
jgi:hypothetical protein